MLQTGYIGLQGNYLIFQKGETISQPANRKNEDLVLEALTQSKCSFDRFRDNP